MSLDAHPTFTVRALTEADLRAYKALRDRMLQAHPDAFTSDAETEAQKPAHVYLGRLGLDRSEGGHFLLGAFAGGELIGAIGCDRDKRAKVRHLAQLVGMMVRPAWRGRGVGHALIEACIARARNAGVETLTLTVTASNAAAERLYERAGFVRYGVLTDAVREGGHSHAKALMSLALKR
jgi:ribosomal protein S18 acetylase RimI-like enzyme